MKPIALILLLALLCIPFSGCTSQAQAGEIVATTLPVYQFTTILCERTSLSVTRLISESVSCLHDYALSVNQVKAIESATLVVISGAGLEEFMDDILYGKETIDASTGVTLLESCHSHHHDHDSDHEHEYDAHIWLSPINAMGMAESICRGLQAEYPQYSDIFEANLASLLARLQALYDYGNAQLSQLSNREIITFHDGFTYFAHCFDLEILAAVEEESGSEASAQELIELIQTVREHNLSAIFIEENGSVSAASIISVETGTGIFTLNMAMAGEDYFDAMYHNIDTIKEAMG